MAPAPPPIPTDRPTPAVPGSFTAFVVERSDDGEIEAGVRTLGLDDLPDGEVLVAVEWSAVNYKDGMVTRPGNRVARINPLVPGVDLVGTVLPSSDPQFAPGLAVIVHGYDLGVSHHGGSPRWPGSRPAGWSPSPTASTPARPPPSAPPASPPRCPSTGSNSGASGPGTVRSS